MNDDNADRLTPALSPQPDRVLGDPAVTDSAGQPWAGRSFEASPFDGDDGQAAPEVVTALARFRAGQIGQAEVVDALRGVRLLIPLVAHAGDVGINARGQKVDKTQELAIVTVAGPDGRTVLPVFSSVAAMNLWRPEARPVPASAVRVAVAAAGEQTDVVVLDPTSETEFAIRRPALWAMAKEQPWLPSFTDPVVQEYFASSVQSEPEVVGLSLAAGDPDARLAGPELTVRIELSQGLDREQLGQIVRRLEVAWAGSEIVADRVDSLGVSLVASG